MPNELTTPEQFYREAEEAFALLAKNLGMTDDELLALIRKTLDSREAGGVPANSETDNGEPV